MANADVNKYIRQTNASLGEVGKVQSNIKDKDARYAVVQLAVAVDRLTKAVEELNKD